MSDFYSDIYEDVDDLLEDFGRPVTINGILIEKVLMNDEGQGVDESRGGITIHLKSYMFKDGLIRRPKFEETVTINDETCSCNGSEVKHGILILKVCREIS